MEFFDAMTRFLEQGGAILWMILGVTVILFTLLSERYWYVQRSFPAQRDARVSAWRGRRDFKSWQAHRIREMILSDSRLELELSMPVIRVLVALLPMLGLLGTVVGMINIFDVMAVTGTGNARAMASGVSMATIPTMAGMVVAVVGIFSVSQLDQAIKNALALLSDQMHEES